MKKTLNNYIILFSAFAICMSSTSCDDDYVPGKKDDAYGTWSISNPTAEMNIITDKVEGSVFYDAMFDNIISDVLVAESSSSDSVIATFVDNNLTNPLLLPQQVSMIAGEEYIYGKGTYPTNTRIRLKREFIFGEGLPTIASIADGVVGSLGEDIAVYLNGFQFSTATVSDMEIELIDYTYSIEISHGMQKTSTYIVSHFKIKKLFFKNAPLVNTIVMPMVLKMSLLEGLPPLGEMPMIMKVKADMVRQ